jgi:Mn2+/Fe2+ NRAMP family transporter
VVSLAHGVGVNLDHGWGKLGIGVVLLGSACWIVYLYGAGARGLRIYERAVKTLVWAIVVAFAVVVFATGVEWKRFFLGITGISFARDYVFGGRALSADAIKSIVGGLAAAVGINMVFLYPYSLLNKNWGKKHKELAYFDLFSGMLVPFVIATSLMMIAVANTIGPAEGEQGAQVNNILDIVPVLSETFHRGPALFIIGLGMVAVGFSTIITHMLACGFIGCEVFGFEYKGRAKWWFSLMPAMGVLGVAYGRPWFISITASTLAAPLMPIAVICFAILLNRRSYMGEATPRGPMRVFWNVMLALSVVVMSVAAWFGLSSNWQQLRKHLAPDQEQTIGRVIEEPARAEPFVLQADNIHFKY